MENNLCCVLNGQTFCSSCSSSSICEGCRTSHLVSRVGQSKGGCWMYCPETQQPMEWKKFPQLLVASRRVNP